MLPATSIIPADCSSLAPKRTLPGRGSPTSARQVVSGEGTSYIDGVSRRNNNLTFYERIGKHSDAN